jgi:Recombination endonuclease VII
MTKSNYEKVKEWRKRNPDKVAEQNKRYAKRHPETHEKAAKKYRENNLQKIREDDKLRQRARRKADPAAQKRRMEHYLIRREAKRWEIAGRPRAENCDICLSNVLIVFDHCHKTNKFRGWICDRCNKILGLVKDSSELLKKLANYLEKFNEQINIESKECTS